MNRPDFIKQLHDLEAVSANWQGVTVSCRIQAEYNEKTESYIFSISSTLKNDGERKLTSITFLIDFIGGEETVFTDTENWLGVDRSLDQWQSVAYESGFQSKLAKKPEKITVRVKELKDVAELPLYHLPLPGEYLYQAIDDEHINQIKEKMPVKVIIQIGSIAGIRSENVEDAEQIRKIVEAFCSTKIFKREYAMVTDNDNALCFEFADGYKYIIRFNMTNLELYVFGRYYLYSLTNRLF